MKILTEAALRQFTSRSNMETIISELKETEITGQGLKTLIDKQKDFSKSDHWNL